MPKTLAALPSNHHATTLSVFSGKKRAFVAAPCAASAANGALDVNDTDFTTDGAFWRCRLDAIDPNLNEFLNGADPIDLRAFVENRLRDCKHWRQVK